MAKTKKSPKEHVPQASPKPRFDVLTVITLIGVAAALVISLAGQQRLKRLEERLNRIDARAAPLPRTPGGSEAPSVPVAGTPNLESEDLYSSVEDQVSLNVDSATSELAGVRPVPSREPDSNRVYSIRTDGAPTRGPAGAPVTIVEFSDFQCSFCKRAKPTIERILEVYGDHVRLVWKHLPLSMHFEAPAAHLASVAAANQGSFWEFHNKLFENPGNLKPDDLRQYALELGLSMQTFEEDLLDPRTRGVVEADMDEAVSVDLTATPGFFINGRFLRGAKPFETFAALINAELERLGLPVPPAARVDEAAQASSPAS